MNAIKRNTVATLWAITLAAGGVASTSVVKEVTRNRVEEVASENREEHLVTMWEMSGVDMTIDTKSLHVNIQTAYGLLEEMIQTNRRFHWFWSFTSSRLPLSWDTEHRLKEIQASVRENPSEENLKKAFEELQKITEEFAIIMRQDEDEVYETLREGSDYISAGDIRAVQVYMSTCLKTVEQELTLNGVHADYMRTRGTELGTDIERFIGENNEQEARKILKKLIDHYTQVYEDKDSQLAFHHLAEIAERLQSGDKIWEIVGKKLVGDSAHIVVIFVGLSILYLMIKVLGFLAGVQKTMSDMKKVEKWVHFIVGILGTIGVNIIDIKDWLRIKIGSWNSEEGMGLSLTSDSESFASSGIIDVDVQDLPDTEEGDETPPPLPELLSEEPPDTSST